MSFSNNKEFSLRPSNWQVLPTIIFASIPLAFGFPFLFIFVIYQYIYLYCWRYDFNERTLTERKGVFSVERREMYYSRIKSIKIDEPFWLRIVGLCNITIISSEQFAPVFELKAIEIKDVVKEFLDHKTDEWRKKDGIREFDIYNL